MLKRKLDRAGLLAVSFLFMAATPGTRTVTNSCSADCNNKLHNTSIFGGHAFDSNGICVCLPELNDDELLNAPRIQLNKQASSFVKQYLGENDFYLQKIKTKSSSYFTLIDSVFSSHDLPVELKYLAVIESKLNPSVYSKAGAAGLWQMMPAPARSFGLKVSGKTDERKNAYKSTIAAAKCIAYLNNIFDDWLLTLAAYNCGPGGVLKAIKKSGSRNFWVLQNYLPLETRKHVMKFISIHYFFEGHGSLTTLTKAETQAHIIAVAGFVAKQEAQKEKDSLVVEIIPNTIN